jgi:hypothetical protein
MQSIATLMYAYPSAHWMTGPVSLLREDGVNCSTNPDQLSVITAKLHSQGNLSVGMEVRRFKFIQQEGTFWSDWLWKAVGQRLNADLRFAGDFELWTRMAQHADLITVLAPLGAFRRRQGQLSSAMDKYMEEVGRVQDAIGVARSGTVVNQEARVAYCDWPGGNWLMKGIATEQIEMRVWTDGTHIQFLDFAGLSSSSSHLVQGACGRVACSIPDAGELELEGPFPNAGLSEPFYWLTGHETRLFLWPVEPGWHQVHLRMANLHLEQTVTVTGAGLRQECSVSVSHPLGDGFNIALVMDIPTDGYELKLAFSKAESLPGDIRELACILLGVDMKHLTMADRESLEGSQSL